MRKLLFLLSILLGVGTASADSVGSNIGGGAKPAGQFGDVQFSSGTKLGADHTLTFSTTTQTLYVNSINIGDPLNGITISQSGGDINFDSSLDGYIFNTVLQPTAGVLFGTSLQTIAWLGTVDDVNVNFTDNTTNNVSTSKHGFTPKLPNDSTKFLNGIGTYTVPPGGGGGGISTINTLTNGATNFTWVTNTLQPNSTFYVNQGNVQGQMLAGSFKLTKEPSVIYDNSNLPLISLDSSFNDDISIGTRVNATGNGFNFCGSLSACHDMGTGDDNACIGQASCYSIISGQQNACYGELSCRQLTDATRVVGIGFCAGAGATCGGGVADDVHGNRNTWLGYYAGPASNSLNDATAIGSGAIAASSHTVALGGPNDNIVVGGTTTPRGKLDVPGTLYVSSAATFTSSVVAGSETVKEYFQIGPLTQIVGDVSTYPDNVNWQLSNEQAASANYEKINLSNAHFYAIMASTSSSVTASDGADFTQIFIDPQGAETNERCNIEFLDRSNGTSLARSFCTRNGNTVFSSTGTTFMRPDTRNSVVTIANRDDLLPNKFYIALATTAGSSTYSNFWTVTRTTTTIGNYLSGSSATFSSNLTVGTLDISSATFLTTSSATATYLQLSSASVTYLTKSSATATYLINTVKIPNSLIDGSSITKQGILLAGSNITLTPAAGSLTIASTGGGAMAIGSPVTSGTDGSVLFVDASGNLGQNNSQFYRNNTTGEFHVIANSAQSAIIAQGDIDGATGINDPIIWNNPTGVTLGALGGYSSWGMFSLVGDATDSGAGCEVGEQNFLDRNRTVFGADHRVITFQGRNQGCTNDDSTPYDLSISQAGYPRTVTFDVTDVRTGFAMDSGHPLSTVEINGGLGIGSNYTSNSGGVLAVSPDNIGLTGRIDIGVNGSTPQGIYWLNTAGTDNVYIKQPFDGDLEIGATIGGTIALKADLIDMSLDGVIIGALTGDLMPSSPGGGNFGQSGSTFGTFYTAANYTSYLNVATSATINGKLTVAGAIDPVSISLSSNTLFPGTTLFMESSDGQSTAVSAAHKGRIIYNDSTKTWQLSANGSAFQTISTATSSGSSGGGYALQPATVTIQANQGLTATFINATTSATIKAVTDGSSASSGNYGEGGSSFTATINCGSSAAYFDLVSVSLSTGDWDLTGNVQNTLNGAIETAFYVGITTNSGTSTGGVTFGKTFFQYQPATTNEGTSGNMSVQYNLGATKTYYLKSNCTYTGGPPQVSGTMTWRRASH